MRRREWDSPVMNTGMVAFALRKHAGYAVPAFDEARARTRATAWAVAVAVSCALVVLAWVL